MKMWGCIFALPVYSVVLIILRLIIPIPTYLMVLLSPFVLGNIAMVLYAFWLLRKVNRELENPSVSKPSTFSISKN